jgi:hypothetical protein
VQLAEIPEEWGSELLESFERGRDDARPRASEAARLNVALLRAGVEKTYSTVANCATGPEPFESTAGG